MTEIKFEYSVGSDDSFNDLVADIGFDDQLVAMLTQEDGFENLRIIIYPPENTDFWNFRFDEFEAVIQKARKRLEELQRKDS